MTTKTKERPIIFSGAMVKAILEGRKTMTRRVVKLPRGCSWYDELGGEQEGWWVDESHPEGWWSVDELSCPYGAPGDRLWVRETWATVYCDVCDGDAETGDVAFYRADYEDDPSEVKWRSPYHMPRWASRITLEITGLRIERLNAITPDDAKAEGVECCEHFQKAKRGHPLNAHWVGFAWLWKSINGEQSWLANPWVWVVEFKVV